MKTKSEHKNQPGWQQLIFSGSNLDLTLENDGSEDDEYSFYNLTGKDHCELEMEKRE